MTFASHTPEIIQCHMGHVKKAASIVCVWLTYNIRTILLQADETVNIFFSFRIKLEGGLSGTLV